MPKPRSTNAGGKLVDTWHYEYQALHEQEPRDDEDQPRQFVEPKKVAIEVRIVKKFTGDRPPLAVKEVHFVVECKEADFSIQGPDIEALRAAMWEHLDTRYKVKWERYFLVEVEHRGPYEGLGTGLSFGWQIVDKGVAWDGTLLLRRYRHYSGEVIEPWPGEFRNKNNRVLACIPATKFNKEALEEFQRRLDTLRERLADYLKPEEILKTLANLNGLALLPSGEEDEDNDEGTTPS